MRARTRALIRSRRNQLSARASPRARCTEARTRRSRRNRASTTPTKPDRQTPVCFRAGRRLTLALSRYGPRSPRATLKSIESGRVLGRHMQACTTPSASSSGLGIAADAPLYVKRIDAAENRVSAKRQRRAFSRELMANDFNWIAYDVPPRVLRDRACATRASRRRQSRCRGRALHPVFRRQPQRLSHRVRPSC